MLKQSKQVQIYQEGQDAQCSFVGLQLYKVEIILYLLFYIFHFLAEVISLRFKFINSFNHVMEEVQNMRGNIIFNLLFKFQIMLLSCFHGHLSMEYFSLKTRSFYISISITDTLGAKNLKFVRLQNVIYGYSSTPEQGILRH